MPAEQVNETPPLVPRAIHERHRNLDDFGTVAADSSSWTVETVQ